MVRTLIRAININWLTSFLGLTAAAVYRSIDSNYNGTHAQSETKYSINNGGNNRGNNG